MFFNESKKIFCVLVFLPFKDVNEDSTRFFILFHCLNQKRHNTTHATNNNDLLSRRFLSQFNCIFMLRTTQKKNFNNRRLIKNCIMFLEVFLHISSSLCHCLMLNLSSYTRKLSVSLSSSYSKFRETF